MRMQPALHNAGAPIARRPFYYARVTHGRPATDVISLYLSLECDDDDAAARGLIAARGRPSFQPAAISAIALLPEFITGRKKARMITLDARYAMPRTRPPTSRLPAFISTSRNGPHKHYCDAAFGRSSYAICVDATGRSKCIAHAVSRHFPWRC